MRWLITGAGGQLASYAEGLLRASGDEVTALSEYEFDITSGESVDRVVADLRPDVVFNAAAYTAVDKAESDEALAAAVNDDGPRLLASAIDTHGGHLLHVSTDYVFSGVFSGDATEPYEPDDLPAPRTVYGRTKLAGEIRVRATLPDRAHVVRTAWVYGGPGQFVDTMRRLEGERDTLDVVNDQIGSPTWVGDLAAALIELGRSDVPGGTLHYVNTGRASWFDLARETFRLIGADPERVHPTDTASFPRPAPRPAWSVLSTRSWTDAGLTAPRPWQDALADSLR